MNTNWKKSHHSTLERIIHVESGSHSVFEVKRNLLKPTHVEEGLVLNACKTWMMQVVAEHEVSWLLSNSKLLSSFCLVWFIKCVIDTFDFILTCHGIKLALHQNVEEETCCRIVCYMSTYVNCPEKWVAVRILRVRESDKVHCHVANNTLIVHNISYWASEFLNVHLWQAGCWEKAPSIHVLGCFYSIEGTHQSALTWWLNEERDRWLRYQIGRTQRRRLNNSSNGTKPLQKVIPSLEQTLLSNHNFLWNCFNHHFFKLLDDWLSHLNSPFSEFRDSFNLEYINWGMSPAIKLVVNFENPSVDVEVICNQLHELIVEIFLIIDVMSSNRHGYISLLKHSLGTRLCWEDGSVVGVTSKDWARKLDRKLNVPITYFARDYVSLFSFNHLFYAFDGLGR